jgi:hypothetical protein
VPGPRGPAGRARQDLPDGKPAGARRPPRGLREHLRPARRRPRPARRPAGVGRRRGDGGRRERLLPRPYAVRRIPRRDRPAADARARRRADPGLERGLRGRPGGLLAGHAGRRAPRGRARPALRVGRLRSLAPGDRARPERGLQPVRGAARPADPPLGAAFREGRRAVADRRRCAQARQMAAHQPDRRTAPDRPLRRGVLPLRVAMGHAFQPVVGRPGLYRRNPSYVAAAA